MPVVLVEHAARHNKRLIPIVRREVDRREVAETLAERHWIFFRETDDFAVALETLLSECDPYCRGAVILGLNQPLRVLADSFAQATNPVVKGFMVGRSLWVDPSMRWLRGEIDDTGLVNEVAENFAALVDAWRTRGSAKASTAQAAQEAGT